MFVSVRIAYLRTAPVYVINALIEWMLMLICFRSDLIISELNATNARLLIKSTKAEKQGSDVENAEMLRIIELRTKGDNRNYFYHRSNE